MKPKSPQPLIIKKYENRRLYDTLTSQYINQDQVAQMVRDGYDLRVMDAATGEDITRLVLAQIVLEDAKTPNSVFPLDVLRQMIIASGKATQDNALRYMKTFMDMYQNAYRAMPNPLNSFGFFPGSPATDRHVNDPLVASATGTHMPEPSGGEVMSADESPSEVSELRRRLEELEDALSRRGSKMKKRKTKPRRKS